MATSEIITSTKFGPAVAVSLVVASNLLFVSTYLGWVDPARAALLLPTLFTIFLISYRIFLQHNATLNYFWLKFFRNIAPVAKLEAHDYRDEHTHQTFLAKLTVSNSTYHTIEKYLILFFVPIGLIPKGSNKSANQDDRRSTSTHICLKIPGSNEKDVPAISTSDPRIVQQHLTIQQSSLTKETLNLSINYVVVVEGLVVADIKVPLSRLFELSTDTKLSIKPVRS